MSVRILSNQTMMKNFSIAVLCLIVIVLFISFSSFLVRAFDSSLPQPGSIDQTYTGYDATSQVLNEDPVEYNNLDEARSVDDGLIFYEAEPELEIAETDFTFTQTGPIVIPEEKHDTSPALRDMPPLPLEKDGIREMPLHDKYYGSDASFLSFSVDTVVQTYEEPLVSSTILKNFEGLGLGIIPGGIPPDTNGAAGLTQYVQWVNRSFAVFDKSTGQVVNGGGPFAGNILWYNFGDHPCKNNNDGDPIAQYDKIANRWVMMQPVFYPPLYEPYYLCVAVSTTEDATGQYYTYAFPTGNVMPDYPKLGVWPDGYYLSYNGSPSVCVLDRSNMLSGNSTRGMYCFNPGNTTSYLPSDLDGSTLPPTGAPNYFLGIGNPLQLWKFHMDWDNPYNISFTGPTYLTVANYNSACGVSCIPQKGTTVPLDGRGFSLMYRLAYRNFGDHDTLVVNHSVGTGSNIAVRWYEIRNPGTTPYVYQQGTYSPDSNYRWMGSIAMDRSGNIGLGYSVSNSSMYPAIRYTGREPADPLGTMQAETSIIEGTGSSTFTDSYGRGRWGDYSSMSIDPVDDCTFWYTTEYLQTTGSEWRTRIASFKFPNCGLTSISVNTSPSTRQITVDNQNYTAPQNFYWSQGSSHSLNAASPQSGGTGTQYVFSSWSDGGAQSHNITTPSSYTTYTANFSTQYQLTSAVSPSGAGSVSPSCQAGCWYNSGSSVGLSATANSNYVFSSWSGDCSGTSSSTNVTMTASKSCTANFAPAITITASPIGRQLIVDSTTYTAPQTFYWPVGSSHSISVSSPQSGATGTQYVFSSWSDGGAQSHNITTPSSYTTYTANFSTQYQLTTAVSPSGAGSVSPGCQAGCWYNSGSSVGLNATANSNYVFSSWSGNCSGTSSSTNVTMTAPKSCTANFAPAITITASPAGRQLIVDSATYTAPQTFYWPVGSSHSISVSSPQSGATGTQYVFSSWSDGGAQTHNITTPSSYTTYTANFNTQYQLTTAVSPSGAGSVSPSCQAGCWYNSGSSVGLNATANSNYVFSSWSGNCSGTSSSTNVTMTAPKSCTANFAPAITITASPAGRQLIVDSATYTAPQTFYWPVGSSHSISVSSPQSGATGTQYVFSSWSDGGAQSHNITTPSAATTFTSYFTAQYQLTTSFSPGEGGSVTPDCSGTCWQNSGPAALTAAPNSGYTFNSWAGDCSGLGPLVSLDMNAPKTCAAGFSACGSQPVKNLRTALSYGSISNAYSDTANTLDGDTLQVLGTTSIENPDLNRAISVVLKSGYACDFSGNGSYTFINGLLTITNGAVTIENLVIK